MLEVFVPVPAEFSTPLSDPTVVSAVVVNVSETAVAAPAFKLLTTSGAVVEPSWPLTVSAPPRTDVEPVYVLTPPRINDPVLDAAIVKLAPPAIAPSNSLLVD